MEVKEKLTENYGRLAVDLNLEDRVLANGVLPDRDLSERGAVVTGMIDHLLEIGEWRRAIGLCFGESPARLLYDNKSAFGKKLLNVPDNQFETYRGEGEADKELELLVKHIDPSVVENLIFNKEIPYKSAVYLAHASVRHEKMGKDRFKESLSAIGKRIQLDKPKEAYKLFQEAEDKQAIEDLYSHLSNTFSLDMFSFITDIIDASPLAKNERKKRLSEVVTRAIPMLGERDFGNWNNTGGSICLMMMKQGLDIPTDRKNKLYSLAVKLLDEHRADDLPENLRLEWAKLHWDTSPSAAYRIFRKADYGGEETIGCAGKIFQHEIDKAAKDKTKIEKDHLEKIFERTDSKDYVLRLGLARTLKDKEELLRVGKIFAEENPNEIKTATKGKISDSLTESYRLLAEGGMRYDAPVFDKVREKLIRNDLTKAKEDHGRPYFFWHDKSDQRGYEQIFEACMNGTEGRRSTDGAYYLAMRRGDKKRIEIAREALFKRNPANRLLRFFKSEEDKEGYDMALTALSKEYGIPSEKVHEFVSHFKKKEKEE